MEYCRKNLVVPTNLVECQRLVASLEMESIEWMVRKERLFFRLASWASPTTARTIDGCSAFTTRFNDFLG